MMTISEDFESEWIGTYAELYEDKSASEPILDVLQKSPKQWEKQNSKEVVKGVSTSNFWVRFFLKNSSRNQQQLSLVLENPLFDRVQFYIIQNRQVVDSSFLMGDMFPYQEREITHRFFIHELNLPVNETYQIYVKAGKLGGKFKFPMRVYTQKAWQAESNREYIMNGVLMGSMLMLNGLGLLLFLIIRKRYALLFTAQFLWVFFYFVAVSGLGFQYIWPDHFHFQQTIMITIPSLIALFKAWFLIDFFKPIRGQAATRLLRLSIQLQVVNLIILTTSLVFSNGIESYLLSSDKETFDGFMLLIGGINYLLNMITYCTITFALILIYFQKKSDALFIYTIAGIAQFLFVVFLYILFFFSIPAHWIEASDVLLIGYLVEGFIIIALIIIEYKTVISKKDQLQLDLAHQQNQALQNLLIGQEKERKRLSQDIHDGISIRLGQLKKQLLNLNGNYNKKKTNLIGDLANIQDDLRNISHALNPTLLQSFGLKKAINELIFKIELNANDIDLSFDCPDSLALNEYQEKHLYYIIQELLNNAIKHGQAKKITIRLTSKLVPTTISEETQKIKLYFFDSGKGFDLNNLNGEGIGIKNIQSRVAVMGGTFDASRKENGMEQLITL